MKVLFLTQYFPPESGAAQGRLSAWALHLRRSGHEVAVLTAMPNYPKGEILEGYRKRLTTEEQWHGIRVIRTWIYASRNKGFVARLANYLSFVMSSLLLGFARLGRHEVVVVESPPLFLALSGLVISAFWRARFVFNVSDLWPESAVALGIIRNRAIIKLAYWFEGLVCRRADLITGQTWGIVNSIRYRFQVDCVAFVPSGVDVDKFAPAAGDQESRQTRKDLAADGKFVVGYAGLHGLVYDFQSVLEAADALRDRREILFFFIGDGPRKEDMIRTASDKSLSNCVFLNTQSHDRMRVIVPLFDVAILPLRKIPLVKGTLPAKMFEALASGVPVVLACEESEAGRLLGEAQAGVCVEPENPQALAQVILRLYEDHEYRRFLGRNGRDYVVGRYDQRGIARQFEQLLLETCSSGRGRWCRI